MQFTLKNDVLGIEYPIQHFMSDSLHRGEFPSWFNTWSMGFPLQSILSWGVFSTPRMLIGWLLPSNIYVFQLEFLFYIMVSGWCMFKLLKTHFIADRTIALLLSCCYMLSGFTVGSSQWLLYITAMTFVPLLLYCLLNLLKNPSLKYALLFAIAIYLLFTNVHIYLFVVSFYLLVAFVIAYATGLAAKKRPDRYRKLGWLAGASLLAALLCAAPAYFTYELVQHLDRRNSIAEELTFFRSNYLHPDALSSLLLPLSAIKTTHANTEGTVLNSYIGLLPLLLLPVSIMINRKTGNRLSWVLLIASLLFLIISFGHLTPVRGWMNILPAMSRFRHPGVLRVFFNLLFILYLAWSFRKYSFDDLLDKTQPFRKTIIITLWTLFGLALFALLIHAGNTGVWKGSVRQSLKDINAGELWLIGAVVQSSVIGSLLLIIFKLPKLVPLFIAGELIINTLFCTPFFTVSTYSAKEVETIFQSPKDYPLAYSPSEASAEYTDEQGNTWPNINTFRKEVSTQVSMAGPLILEDVSKFLSNDTLKEKLTNQALIFDSKKYPTSWSLSLNEVHPKKVVAGIVNYSPAELILMQADFPGWKIYFNEKPLPLIHDKDWPFVRTIVPGGTGKLEFIYEKKGVQYSALILHSFIVIVLLWYTIGKFRRKSIV